MTNWALIALLCSIGFFLALVAAVISAALPYPTPPHWTDRLRRGATCAGKVLTLYIALVGMIVGLAALLTRHSA
ncbi:hypothetical protein ACFXB3_12615 [Streptomyces sp. NPDC059447]|uniref:hypothetical protein n=1 Tax=Streptomyces sp. NPDC059447 TaxID=3346834 RepID=UPI0036AA8BB8